MRHSALFFVLLISSCSALVEIDDEKYLAGINDGDGDGGNSTGGGSGDGDLGGSWGDGDGDGGTGGDGNTGGSDGDTGGIDGGDGDSASGGMGGTSAGGTGGGATGGGGTGGDGTGGIGTGGTMIQIREPDHYYPLDGNADDEGSAAPLTATANGAVIWRNTGLRGGSLDLPLNMTSDLTFDPLLAGASPFTISWWFVSAKDGYITLASRFPNQQGQGSWELIADTSRPRIKVGNQEIFYTAEFPPADEGVWSHIALCYSENALGSNDHIQVWFNGTTVLNFTDGADAAIAADANLKIGQGGNGTEPFRGLLDEIRVYNVCLSDEEVQALYLFDAPP